MDVQEFIKLKDDRKAQPMAFDKTNAIGQALNVQVHTRGIYPKYKLNGQTYIPKDYDSRYDAIFKTKLLNQYPNEDDEMYQYRLSIYSPIQQEISSRFQTAIVGTILNPNNYSIGSSNESFMELLPKFEREFDKWLKFMLENPTSFYAVIQTNAMAGEDARTRPEVVCIDATNVVMYDHESVAFNHNGVVWFMDHSSMYAIKTENQKAFIVQAYVHNFGSIPFWKVTNEFLQQYVVWCNEITKSHSDSQIVDKNYSHPVKQVLEVECRQCMGRGSIADVSKPDCDDCTVTCNACHGHGKMPMSPGQVYGVPEHIIRTMGTIPQIASFTTPDIGIPTYHGEKWEKYYMKAENSLHLTKRGSASESGDAKREDRKDSYFYIQTISSVFFNHVIKPALYYIGYFVNTEIRDNMAVHAPIMIDIRDPRQFDLMTDIDLIDETNSVADKTTSPMLLAEMTNAMNEKLYSQNPELRKINRILYSADPLYGLTGNAEKAKLISGVYTPQQIWIHTMGYFTLKQYLMRIGSEAFMQKNNADIEAFLVQMANDSVPNMNFNE